MTENVEIIRQTRKQFTLTYPEGTDFSGKSPKMEVKKIYTDDVLFTLTSGSGISVTDNVVTITISTAQTELMVDDKYKTDLIFIESSEVTDRTPIFYFNMKKPNTERV